MIYVTKYNSPIGEILLASMDDKIIGLWFLGQKYFFNHIKEEIIEEETEVLRSAKKWLDDYFLGKKPSIKDIPLNPNGSSFQKRVWRILCDIPYGETITYKKIANKITEEIGMSMSAQAVGGAVGRNPISIIIPCHRVVGKNGTLTGYAGRKKKTQLYPYEKNVKLEIKPEESSSAQAYSSAFPQSRHSVRRRKKTPRARDAAIFAFGAGVSALFCTVIYYSGIFL